MPKLKATRSIVESATAVRAVGEWAHPTVREASRAPTKSPAKKPTMAHTCTRPPTRAPWTAASTATTTTATSTAFTVRPAGRGAAWRRRERVGPARMSR